jgi:FAD/FMN-containing dehydrogenase
MPIVNDIHSQLNETEVARVLEPRSVADVQHAIAVARTRGQSLAVAGGRHAMGGQQFSSGGLLLDMRRLDRVLDFDREAGQIEIDAGIQWPALMRYLQDIQAGAEHAWGIAQKQTGADRFSLGGSVSANVHGRGLAMRPLVADIESLVVAGSDGELRRCSRTEHPELFRLVVGGYGLFGVVVSVRLRLVRRRTVERVVELESVDNLAERFEERITDGYLYGDLQFAIDPDSSDFLRRGVFSCYRPVHDRTIPVGQKRLSTSDWQRLLELAHVDKAKAFDAYTGYYLSTSGQLYHSDAHQMADYLDGYHEQLDRRVRSHVRGSEMIGELYVPRERLADFMGAVAEDFRRHRVDVVYGTIRAIEADGETFLPWARDRYACVIFNLHLEHTPEALARGAQAFRDLIDLGIAHGGSYYLTYHRWARRDQVERCYPQMREFLELKRRHDPAERFQSSWYRHYRTMFA